MNKINVKYPEFSAVDFIELYCAISFKNGLSPIIVHHELEKKLYEFYSLPEFEELFQDICPKKDSINSDNSYLDLGISLNKVQLFGLLTPIHGATDATSIVSCDDDICQKIISNYDTKIVDKMTNLFNTIHNIQVLKLVKSN